MDQAGWVEIDAVLRQLRMSRADLDQAVLRNNKSRLEVRGSQIRVSQGHSLDAMPVTQEALEASWERFAATASVWHGTRAAVELLTAIGAQGLSPQERTHVHLAATTDSVVGKRSNVGLLLEVSPAALQDAGLSLFRSPNGVVLARRVPPECIVGVRLLTTRARKQASELRAALGL